MDLKTRTPIGQLRIVQSPDNQTDPVFDVRLELAKDVKYEGLRFEVSTSRNSMGEPNWVPLQ